MTQPARAAILGYGNQGAAQAFCLRQSGWQVVVGSREGKSADRARGDGFEVRSLPEATSQAEYVVFLLPDEVVPTLHKNSLAGALKSGSVAVFAHGFSLRHGNLVWPGDIDVVLVSPTAPGSVLAREYAAGRGVPAYLAAVVDSSGRAWDRAEHYARGIGSDRAQLLRTTLEEEVIIDLFGEQAVLVGGLLEIVAAAVNTLIEAGHTPEMAYLECVHQLKYLADLLHQEGPDGFLGGVSATALYGALSRGPRVIGEESRRELAKMLKEIEDGSFADEFIADQKKGGPRLADLLRQAQEGRLARLSEAHGRALGQGR